MLDDKDHFKFFENLIHLKGDTFNEVNWNYIADLPKEEKTNLTLDENGFLLVRDSIYSFFIRKSIKSEKYRSYFKEYIEKEKIALRKDISKNLVNKPLVERIEILKLKLYEIHDLIVECRNSKKRHVDLLALALIDVSKNFLIAYKSEFDKKFYVQMYTFLDQKEIKYTNGYEDNSISKDIDISEPPLPQKELKTLRLITVKPITICIAQINDLHKQLKGKIECDSRDFRAVFEHGVMNEKPLWTGDINELRYLINKLIEKGFIRRPADSIKWKTVAQCFRLPDKELMKDMLRTTKDPNDTSFIDKATAHISR